MTNHKKSCFCCFRRRVTLKKRSRQLFFCRYTGLTILSGVWDLFLNKCRNCLFCTKNRIKNIMFCFCTYSHLIPKLFQLISTTYKILYLSWCSDYNLQILFNLLILGDRLPDLRWKGVSITCEDLVPYLIEDDSGINLGIWGTTYKNTNNYFWRVFLVWNK